ncbi:hypothetical protein PPL_08839 [Heterostelium album PN500]|uniref:SPIN90/Ldb17 leucine-rich domain-containing protein n=1 Tax=Heterostelium pallidum (strain ATCC 26659 / Pp 5 / PN500) TaxID=670386 RepID=D3BJV9_HETP5|nr:hypothetical protein PPL_08839 [Heterostelium album PN500]EFA78189.1 hypothetical protein PPL_08839 [Heterostelium album PN500]|eukprot:XP_020430315.1 hypothetical protein PPL_08839 [Heterostelium album PN500]
MSSSSQDITYYSMGLSNTVSHLLQDEEYLQNESGCKMILYLASMGYMPPEETTDTMMTLLKTKKEETLVNYIMAVFHQLFDRYQFHIDFHFDLLQSVLMSIDHYYNDVPLESGITHIPIYNSISLLNYFVLVLQHLTDQKVYDNPLKTILERNRKVTFFKAIFSVVSKCDLEVYKNILKLITISDTSRRPLEVFVITINQLLQSILFTEQYAPDQDWQAVHNELTQFTEIMKMEKDVDKVITINLLIMDTLVNGKLIQYKNNINNNNNNNNENQSITT